jgi:transcriptional regulator PpsR
VKLFDASDPAYSALDANAAASLLAAAGDIAVLVDPNGVVRDVSVGPSDVAVDLHRAWVGRPWPDTATSDTRLKIETLLREVATKGVSKRRQVNHTTASGADLPIAYTAMRVGRDGSVVAVGRDMRHLSSLQQRLVEAQQAMERDYWRLRHVETRYRLLFQLASDGILVIDSGTMKVLDANTAAGQVFGDVSDRLVGRTFPFGVDVKAARALEDLVTSARASGRAGDVTISLLDSDRPWHVSASCFRQESATLLLVRFSAADSTEVSLVESGAQSRIRGLIERSPDAFVVTDLDGHILEANRSFLDVAELATLEQARGALISTFIGRPGADFPVFLTMLKKHGAVRLVATAARGSHGANTEVEVSAVWVPDAEEPCIGFTMRDIGRRLANGPQGARDLTRAVEDLTSLVGRVTLRDLVRDTIDLVERHFIEAALELTNDNRTSAAEVLGVSRQSLYVKLRRHRLAAPSAERDGEAAD